MKTKAKTQEMTTLTFHGVGGCAEILLDRTAAIRIAGAALFAGGPAMATYAHGAWYVGDQRLERITVRGPVRVEFDARSGGRTFGPFAEFSLIGDAAIAAGRVFARYRPAEQAWSFGESDVSSEGRGLRDDPALSAT